MIQRPSRRIPHSVSPTTIRFALSVFLGLGAVTNARADSARGATSADYRRQAATTDAVALATAVTGFSLEGKDGSLNYVPSNALMGVGTTGYFLGVPIVHVAHRQYGRAAVSLVLRVGLPIIGGTIGARLANCSPDHELFCGLNEFAEGFAIGAVAAVAVDNMLLFSMSPADGATERAAPTNPPSAGLNISPRLAAGPNAAMLGLGGQF